MATYVLKRRDTSDNLKYVKFGWVYSYTQKEIHGATLFSSKNEALKKKYNMSCPEDYILHEVISSKCPID